MNIFNLLMTIRVRTEYQDKYKQKPVIKVVNDDTGEESVFKNLFYKNSDILFELHTLSIIWNYLVPEEGLTITHKHLEVAEYLVGKRLACSFIQLMEWMNKRCEADVILLS